MMDITSGMEVNTGTKGIYSTPTTPRTERYISVVRRPTVKESKFGISDSFRKNIWGDMTEKGGLKGRKNTGYIVDRFTN